MKQAVGVDPASALGTAVREARARVRAEDDSDELSTNVAVPTGSSAPTVPPVGRPKRESVDVEFSTAEVDVDPIPLTTKKTKPPTSECR